MHFNVKEDIIQMTPLWKGERFPDGRPKVSDEDIEKLRHMTLEEIWLPLSRAGYNNQFESHLNRIKEDVKLVGRAVTAAYLPARPDLFNVVEEIGHSEGRRGTHNLWVVDTLVEGDVIVIDFFDRIVGGTFVGGNLSTAIANRTKTGGAVIWGGIRDMEQIHDIENIQVYYRGYDPSPIKDFVMSGFNTPVRIGGAICLPGDIVFAYNSGVLFVPSHMVTDIIEQAEKTHCKDFFGFEMIKQNIYQTADIDIDVWPVSVLDRMVNFINSDERAKQYRHLDWSDEYNEANEYYKTHPIG